MDNSVRARCEDVLVVWDFDHSYVDDNTDTFVFQQAVPEIVETGTKSWAERKKGAFTWTQFIARLLRTSAVRFGVDPDALRDGLTKIKTFPECVSLAKELRAAGCRQLILSDSNTEFIDWVTRAHGTRDCFQDIITNPAKVISTTSISAETVSSDAATLGLPAAAAGAPRAAKHFLTLAPFQPVGEPHCCGLCNSNLCKGRVLAQYLLSGTWEKSTSTARPEAPAEAPGAEPEPQAAAEAERIASPAEAPGAKKPPATCTAPKPCSSTDPCSPEEWQRWRLPASDAAAIPRFPSAIVYIGDGRNDVCPAVRLRGTGLDLVCAREGYGLEKQLSGLEDGVPVKVRSLPATEPSPGSAAAPAGGGGGAGAAAAGSAAPPSPTVWETPPPAGVARWSDGASLRAAVRSFLGARGVVLPEERGGKGASRSAAGEAAPGGGGGGVST